MSNESKHVGFYMDVDGTTAHVLGDPSMDAKTQGALAELIRCAVKMMDAKYGPPAPSPSLSFVSDSTPPPPATPESEMP